MVVGLEKIIEFALQKGKVNVQQDRTPRRDLSAV